MSYLEQNVLKTRMGYCEYTVGFKSLILKENLHGHLLHINLAFWFLFTTSMTVFNYCSLHETTLLRPAAYVGELT